MYRTGLYCTKHNTDRTHDSLFSTRSADLDRGRKNGPMQSDMSPLMDPASASHLTLDSIKSLIRRMLSQLASACVTMFPEPGLQLLNRVTLHWLIWITRLDRTYI